MLSSGPSQEDLLYLLARIWITIRKRRMVVVRTKMIEYLLIAFEMEPNGNGNQIWCGKSSLSFHSFPILTHHIKLKVFFIDKLFSVFPLYWWIWLASFKASLFIMEFLFRMFFSTLSSVMFCSIRARGLSRVSKWLMICFLGFPTWLFHLLALMLIAYKIFFDLGDQIFQ